jgi:hypothetical protein
MIKSKSVTVLSSVEFQENLTRDALLPGAGYGEHSTVKVGVKRICALPA